MLDRYTLKPMKDLWSDKAKFQGWHDVECAWMQARVDFNELSSDACDQIKAIQVTSKMIKRIKQLDTGPGGYHHDMIAFVVTVQEQIGDEWASEYHKKITSYDIEDPALIILLREAVGLIIKEAHELKCALSEKALEHKWTLMIGRTHGQYAEPTTFGHLLKVYSEAVTRSIFRLQCVLDTELSEGKMSGAVGMYGEIDPEIEERALSYIGIKAAKAETQILQRDRHAAVISASSILSGTIEQIARTFWEMMRSDVGELREPRKENQRGSSSMPWKRNPSLMERLMGLSRLVRGDLVAQTESIATPESRDISQSIVERHTLPRATSLTHYTVVRMTKCIRDLEVFPDKMKENLDKAQGVWAGQRVQTALMDKGLPYEVAYKYIQREGIFASDHGTPMLKLLSSIAISQENPRNAADILGEESLRKLFDPKEYIQRGIEHIFGE